MKKIGFLAILGLVLLSSTSMLAKPAPNGVNNYIKDGHLYVWYNDQYVDMGLYNPG